MEMREIHVPRRRGKESISGGFAFGMIFCWGEYIRLGNRFVHLSRFIRFMGNGRSIETCLDSLCHRV